MAERLTRRTPDLDEHGSSLAHRVVSLEITKNSKNSGSVEANEIWPQIEQRP